MTDEERFLEVLQETWSLVVQLGDLKGTVVVIGGQVIALHALSRNQSAAIETSTDTGVKITRGFTHEPDLLFELQNDHFGAERLVEVLKQRGYKWLRGYRWGRSLESGTEVLIDFFRSPELEAPNAPLVMTPLVDAESVFPRTQTLAIPLGGEETRWRVPDSFGFLTTKVRAKREQRPTKSKDSFDMFVFVKLLGIDRVNAELDAAPARASTLRTQLSELFWTVDSPGVLDVLAESGLSEPTDRDLVARDVVDLFVSVTSR